MGYITLKEFLQSRAGLLIGLLFIVVTGIVMAPQATVINLFPHLFNAMPIMIPAVLLSLWLNTSKSFSIRRRLSAGTGFFVILLAISLLYAVADMLIYKAGLGVIFTSYLALLLMILIFAGISALAFMCFKNPALKTLSALFLCLIFFYFTKGDFIALSSGMLGLTDAVYLLSFVLLVLGLLFILVTYKSAISKIMHVICLVIILLSANLVVKPFDATAYLDFSMGKQFSVRAEDQAHLAALSKPVKVTLFLPRSVIAQNHDAKAFAKTVARYLVCLSRHANGFVTFEDLAGVPVDGDFAIIITDDDGKEDYLFLPGKGTTRETQRILLKKVLTSGGVPDVLLPPDESKKPLNVMAQDKASLLWNLVTGIYFGLGLLWLVLFWFYRKRQKKGR